MKTVAQLICLALISIITVSCDSGPPVGGKPLSHWIDALEDQSESTVVEAMNMIAQVDKDQAEAAREPLAKLAESGKGIALRGRAAVVYFQKFKEVESYSIDPLFYVVQYEDDLKTNLAASRALSEMTERADEIVPKAIEIILKADEPVSQASMSATGVLRGMGKPALDALEKLPRQNDTFKQMEIETAIESVREEIKAQ